MLNAIFEMIEQFILGFVEGFLKGVNDWRR